MLTDYKKTKFEDILADAQEKGEEAINLVVSMVSEKVSKEVTNKKGVTKTKEVPANSFLQVKKAYFSKYYPDLVPVAKKEKAKPMLEVLKNAGLIK